MDAIIGVVLLQTLQNICRNAAQMVRHLCQNTRPSILDQSSDEGLGPLEIVIFFSH